MLYNRTRSVGIFNNRKVNQQLVQTHSVNQISLNLDEKNECNNIVFDQEGWLQERSRHFKKWKKRYARIEQHQYMCTYQNDNEDLLNCEGTIDITESTLNYTLDKPKEFIIHTKNTNNSQRQYHFKCDSVIETNKWLIILKQITTKKPLNITHLDLVVTKPKSEAKICANSKKKLVSNKTDKEIHEIYMKAVSLYQHKHYEECGRITKSVLTLNPNHKQAIQLYSYLVDKKYNKYANKQNKYKVKRNKSKLFGAKSKVIAIDKQNEEKGSFRLCQIEFGRFLRETIQISEYYPDLNDKFVCAKYYDIRLVKDFDQQILNKEIGLKPLHCKLFMKKIGIFMEQVQLFQEWLKQINIITFTIDGIIDIFENNGILTFEQLHRYIKSKHDLEKLIKQGGDDCDILWNEIQNIDKRNKKSSPNSHIQQEGNCLNETMYI